MRDGVPLRTLILAPKTMGAASPMLLMRTPYDASACLAGDANVTAACTR